jgi:TolB-like protein/class 3 adenylate cyclase/Flp pilus assembly protein TadD
MAATRKIAAILVADVVGYSRLAGADEDRTLSRLRGLRSDLIDPAIDAHQGRVIKRTGDGILIEFRSVVDAVRCAAELQDGMVERNAGLPPERRIEFRVGVHLGDVVEESDGDLMGDGINIAARLEGIARPGGIYVSEDAYRQIKGRLDLAATDMGPMQLKNIAEPIRVFSLQIFDVAPTRPAIQPKLAEPRRFSGLAPLVVVISALLIIIAGAAWYVFAGARTVAPLAEARVGAAHLSIVVLPFVNLSKDPDQDYFADGITENLTTDLSRFPNSFVIARDTAFTFKGKVVDAKEIGKDLGVRYVLEGSVQRDGNRVRVNAQLVDAEYGAHLWADRFEEDVSDLFKLQDQVVARLADSLGYELVKAEAERASRSKSPDVIDLTMRGRALLSEANPTTMKDTFDGAHELFEDALEIDPNDADALTGEALTNIYMRSRGWISPDAATDAKIIGLLDRAMSLAPENLWAYEVKSQYLALSQRPREAVSAADAGLAINTNSAPLHRSRGLAENYLGRFEQARADLTQAIRLSPRNPEVEWWHLILGASELGLGDFDATIEEAQKAVGPGYRTAGSYLELAAAYALTGKTDEAKSALAEARRLKPDLSLKWMKEGWPNTPAMFEGLRKAGLPEE